jgi:hypothetical protein
MLSSFHRGRVWAYKTSLTPPLVIEVLVHKFVPIANSEMKKNCNSTVYNMYNKNIKLKFNAKIFVLSSISPRAGLGL